MSDGIGGVDKSGSLPFFSYSPYLCVFELLSAVAQACCKQEEMILCVYIKEDTKWQKTSLHGIRST